MPWVRPIITVSRCCAGEGDDRADELVGGGDEQAAGVAHRPAQRRVDDVGRRQPVVDPRPGRRPDGRLDDVDERGDVVVGDPLALADGGDERLVDHGRPRRGTPRRRRRDDPELGLRLGGEQLDLQPAAEAGGVRPHVGHLRERVAGDHAVAHCQIR